MLKTLCLATLVVAASAGGALTKCDGDSDCPSSYCMKGDDKSPPFTCHDCGANCCNSDVDCKGSYCMKDQTKELRHVVPHPGLERLREGPGCVPRRRVPRRRRGCAGAADGLLLVHLHR